MTSQTAIADEPGGVVRVYSTSKYPEVWVASYINLGRWYPDTDSWAQNIRGPLDDGGAHVDDLLRRGRVEALSAGDPETFRAGWKAACAHLGSLAEDAQYDPPDNDGSSA